MTKMFCGCICDYRYQSDKDDQDDPVYTHGHPVALICKAKKYIRAVRQQSLQTI